MQNLNLFFLLAASVLCIVTAGKSGGGGRWKIKAKGNGMQDMMSKSQGGGSGEGLSQQVLYYPVPVMIQSGHHMGYGGGYSGYGGPVSEYGEMSKGNAGGHAAYGGEMGGSGGVYGGKGYGRRRYGTDFGGWFAPPFPGLMQIRRHFYPMSPISMNYLNLIHH